MAKFDYKFWVFAILFVILLVTKWNDNGNTGTGSGSSNDTTYSYRVVTVTPEPVDLDIKIPEPKIIYISDTTRRSKNIPDSLIRTLYDQLAERYDSINAERTYMPEFEDSLLEGSLNIKVRGYLLKHEMKYKVKPIIVQDTTIRQHREYTNIYFGGNFSSDMKPFANVYVSRDKMLYSAGYDPINKQIQVGVGVRLFKIKKRK